ncbi:FtsX-like permease family protein [Nocardia sp. NPDC050175]|uniref:FtsX-like permease family protein n=1 Tax=Nocardia sp. NPDC050175 TaxID=3364317 RepID=UPI0037B84EBC
MTQFWTTVRHRKAALVALFFAAALVALCGVLLATGLAGSMAPERYAGSPLVVTGDQQVHWTQYHKGAPRYRTKDLPDRAWVSDTVPARLAAVPGVTRVVSELTFPVHLVKDGQVVDGPESSGHEWDSAAMTPMSLGAGAVPSGAGDVVVDAGTAAAENLNVGDKIQVIAGDGPGSYTVTGITDHGLRQRLFYFSTAEARRLAGHQGQVAAIGVWPASAEDAVRQALRDTPASVQVGDGRGTQEFPDASSYRVKLISMGATAGGTALGIALVVVAGTFTLATQQRLREIALLRAVGATPRQVRSMIGREAIGLGLAAGVSGAVAGTALAALSQGWLVDSGIIPATLRLSLSPIPAAVAVATTLLAAWCAAVVAVWRTSRMHPVEGLREVALSGRGTAWWAKVAGVVAIIGFAGVLTTLVLAHTQKAGLPVSMGGILVPAIAAGFLSVPLAGLAVVLTSTGARFSRVSGYLAAAAGRFEPRRLAAGFAPLILAVSVTCTALSLAPTLAGAAGVQARDGILADYTVTGQAGVPPALAATLRSEPGVAAVTEMVGGSAFVDGNRYSVQGMTPADLSTMVDPEIYAGSLAGMAADTVAVSDNAADGAQTKVGSELKLTLADGTAATMRVVALYRRNLGFGDLILPRDLLAAHVDTLQDNAILIKGGDRARIEAATAAFPGVGITDNAPAPVQSRNNEALNALVVGLVIAFTGIAVVNTFAMATFQRRRELAALRLIGMSRAKIMAMLGWEAGAVGVVSVIVGTFVTLLTLAAFSKGITGSVVPSIDATTYLVTIVGTVAAACLSTIIPAWLLCRTRAVEAIAVRE